MDPNNPGGVEYNNRWNNENINMNVEASQPLQTRIYNTLCTGTTGLAAKIAGGVAVLVVIYVIGYTTGYYVHRC
ncbi:small integral membrane protein 1 [Cololabis saira]|uniref:small integral membrane protein 1 n=1 Tax=Cololabis saira TaxID=129043 RepID=UPI002AD41421|nr:small integral membrane protein 1 [Cololabis saira]